VSDTRAQIRKRNYLAALKASFTLAGLLQRAEEEEKVSTYIATEKLPSDIKACQSQVHLLRQVAAQTSLSRTDLAQVEQQVH
jgi:hypothetical protein